MVIVMKEACPKRDVGKVMSAVREHRVQPRLLSPGPSVIIGIVEEIDGSLRDAIAKAVSGLAGVESIESFGTTWKLVSRSYHEQRTTVGVGGVMVGAEAVVAVAGPCAVESRENILEIAGAISEKGAGILRGGAFKPRTSPYSFRGLGEEGLRYLKEASEKTGMPVVTEALTPEDVQLVAEYADAIQIGARNMQNYSLLEAVGKIDKPVLLKRGMMATVKELLLSAEYIMAKGNAQVILCERGIRTFETETRNTLDISVVPLLKELTHLPVIVDPSHAVGRRELVGPVAQAAVAAGADGVMVEVHTDPDNALSDGMQSLTVAAFGDLMKTLGRVAEAVGRDFSGVTM